MISDTDRFQRAIEQLDTANAQDPNRETWQGREYPKELLYARRMTDWLQSLEPDASEALRLAARAQHLRRWTIPRDRYPRDRPGYKRWRAELSKFHGDEAGRILDQVGYDPETIARVKGLIRKERLKSDPDSQTLEDVVCLVFLENHFAAFAREHDDDKLVEVLRKTWRKMSPRGHQAALELELSPRARDLVARALEASPPSSSGTRAGPGQ